MTKSSNIKYILGIVGLVMVVAAAFLWQSSRSQASAESQVQVAEPFQNVSVQHLREQLSNPDIILLDVREPWEYQEAHIAGVTLIPLGQLEARVSELPDKEIYVICRSGNRSLTASNVLLQAGKTRVRNVQGGMLAWNAAGYPVNP